MHTSSTSGFAAIRPLLKRIGLDDKETEVYLALLSLKMAKASAIAKASKQERTHTYLILRSLEEKGLVSELERGKVRHFVAEPPQRLKQFVENREKELKSLSPLIDGILPILSSLTKPLTGTPRVTMLSGMEGMRQIYRDAFHQEICGIFNPASMYEAFGKNIVTDILGKQPLRGRDLLIDGPATKKYLKEVPPDEGYQVKILPKTSPFTSDMMIVGDTVVLFAYDDQQTIVRIENAAITDTFRAWFEILWAASTLV
jgi:predicted transcriptional regulator